MLNLLLIYSAPLFAQQAVFFGEIGNFNSAVAISINPNGHIFVSDKETNEITKLDTLGKVIRKIGGYGWTVSSFDNPVDLHSNTLNVYVADKNNDRIQIFDKDLNFISEFSSKNFINETYFFRYPTSVGIFSQGDLFILDSDNSRILKFNSRGEFSASLGDYLSGSYQLKNPNNFAICNNGKIVVLDFQTVVIFDLFGNLINKRVLDFLPIKINCSLDVVTISGDSRIDYSFNFCEQHSEMLNTISLNKDSDIVDSAIFKDKLYILTTNKILIYQLIKL
jgi:hypothetical protein